MCPCGLFLGLPVSEGFQSKVKQPLRFALFLGDKAYDIFVQSFLYYLRVDVRVEAIFVVLIYKFSRNVFHFSSI